MWRCPSIPRLSPPSREQHGRRRRRECVCLGGRCPARRWRAGATHSACSVLPVERPAAAAVLVAPSSGASPSTTSNAAASDAGPTDGHLGWQVPRNLLRRRVPPRNVVTSGPSRSRPPLTRILPMQSTDDVTRVQGDAARRGLHFVVIVATRRRAITHQRGVSSTFARSLRDVAEILGTGGVEGKQEAVGGAPSCRNGVGKASKQGQCDIVLPHTTHTSS